MGQMLGSVEGGVQPTPSEAATWCKMFVRIAGTFAGAGISTCTVCCVHVLDNKLQQTFVCTL